MALKSDVKKFWNNHPFLTVIYGVVGTYIVSNTYNAITAKDGEFWGKGFKGLGRTMPTSNPDPDVTWDPMSNRHFDKKGGQPIPPGGSSGSSGGSSGGSSSGSDGQPDHSNEDDASSGDMSGLYGWNQQFGATTSVSTTTSSSHLPALRSQGSDYGEESFESPAQFYGLPNGIKRRIMHGSIGDTDVSLTPTPELMSTVQERHGEILGYAGNLPEQLAGHGWL